MSDVQRSHCRKLSFKANSYWANSHTISSEQGLTKYGCNTTCILSGLFCVLPSKKSWSQAKWWVRNQHLLYFMIEVWEISHWSSMTLNCRNIYNIIFKCLTARDVWRGYAYNFLQEPEGFYKVVWFPALLSCAFYVLTEWVVLVKWQWPRRKGQHYEI